MVRESLVAQIWRHQLIRKETLLTVGGKRVRVVHPGRESKDSGPDFCDAFISVGEKRVVRGDVEIHVHSRDWEAHGHHRDANYDGVILHVVLWNDGMDLSRLHNGERIPILALSSYLAGSLKELSRRPQASSPGEVCAETFERHGRAYVADLLDKAGKERFHLKARRFGERMADKKADQVLYESWMRGLGYAKNKEPFEELARLLPLEVLKQSAAEGPTTIQALMLGTAGLLPRQRHGGSATAGFSDRDKAEMEKLENVWQSFGERDTMQGTDWRFFRVRPENLPPRRIVAASHLYFRYEAGLLSAALKVARQASLSQAQMELEKGFVVGTDGYWASHFDFGWETRDSLNLIGKSRAREIIVNVVLPYLFAWAGDLNRPWLKDWALRLYEKHPRLAENWVTRHMESQIFSRTPMKADSACRQQGLIHLYETFCVERRCMDCLLG